MQRHSGSDTRGLPARASVLRAGALATVAALALAACGNDDSEGGGETSSDGAFYDGKTIHLIVPTDAGGTIDTTSRFLAEYLTKHVEGNPTFVIDNITGGNQLVGANEYALNRAHDGTEVFVNGNGTTALQLFGHPQKEFDYENYEPLIAFGGNSLVMANAQSGITSAEDLADRDEPPTFGGTSPSGTDLANVIALDVLGIDYQPVFGYESNAAMVLAIEQGEIDLNSDSTPSYLRALEESIEADKINPVYTYGAMNDDGTLGRDPLLPDVPNVAEVYELLHGTEVPDSLAWEAYKTIIASRGLSNVLWIFNDAPPEAIQALQDGVNKMVEDPDFIDGIETNVGGNQPVLGEDIQALLEPVLNPDPEVIDWVKNFLAEEFDTEL